MVKQAGGKELLPPTAQHKQAAHGLCGAGELLMSMQDELANMDLDLELVGDGRARSRGFSGQPADTPE